MDKKELKKAVTRMAEDSRAQVELIQDLGKLARDRIDLQKEAVLQAIETAAAQEEQVQEERAQQRLVLIRQLGQAALNGDTAEMARIKALLDTL